MLYKVMAVIFLALTVTVFYSVIVNAIVNAIVKRLQKSSKQWRDINLSKRHRPY